MIHQVVNSKGNYNYNAYIYEDIEWTAHFHRNFELLYCIKGTHTINIGGSEYELLSGELILIPPNTLHAFKVNPGNLVWVAVFSADYIAAFAKINSYTMYSKFRCDEHIEEYLKKVLFFEGIPEKYILKSALYAVCSQCLEKGIPISQKGDADIRKKILDYIYENFDRGITMKTMADSMGYEYHYFSEIFHKCFSMNFSRLLNYYKYEKACELLEKSRFDLSTIAMESGFQSIRTFNSVFKALGGITPGEYRKKF